MPAGVNELMVETKDQVECLSAGNLTLDRTGQHDPFEANLAEIRLEG